VQHIPNRVRHICTGRWGWQAGACFTSRIWRCEQGWSYGSDVWQGWPQTCRL